MTTLKTLTLAAALFAGASSFAMAQGTTGASPGGGAPSATPGSAVNGQESNKGPNTPSYGTKQHQGREQPEQKLDMGSESGKQ